MQLYKDYFSAAASDYSRYRPKYPEELFDYLAEQAPARKLVWDCATGSGQAAVPLAARFERVLATDVSVAQLSRGAGCQGVDYVAAPAEEAPLAAGSVDLLTVSQALHWFSFERFFAEAERVLAPGGVLAAWTYDLLRIDRETDAVVDYLYSEVVGPYWYPERAIVTNGYESIPFPFERLPPPALRMSAEWDRARLIGYLSSWSAVGRYRTARGEDPVPIFERELAKVWPRPAESREVTWRLTLLVGRAGHVVAAGET